MAKAKAKKTRKKPTHVVAGSGKASAARRRSVFAERWLVNGNNGTEAAIHAGYGVKNARIVASQLLARPDVKKMIGTRAEEVVVRAKLSTDRWAEEMAAIAHFDPGELYDKDGNLIPLHQLPEHVRRAIAKVKTETRYEGRGDNRTEIVTEELKIHDKNTALANVGRHLGMFDKDNKQRVNAIQVNIELVG